MNRALIESKLKTIQSAQSYQQSQIHYRLRRGLELRLFLNFPALSLQLKIQKNIPATFDTLRGCVSREFYQTCNPTADNMRA